MSPEDGKFLHDTYRAGGISGDTAMSGFRVLLSLGCGIRPPFISVNAEGRMLFWWDVGPHHLEVEFADNEPAGWFYKDRGAGEYFAEDAESPDAIPESVLAVLHYFTPEVVRPEVGSGN